MLLKVKYIFFDKKFLKFLIVGIFNTIFGYSLFATFIYFNFHYSIAIAIATIIGVIFNFKTVGYFVFQSKDNIKIVKFLLVYIIIYILNTIGVKIISDYGLGYYLSGIVMLIPLALISYGLNLKYVFNIK